MRGYPLAASLDSARSRARALLPRLRRGPRSIGEDMFGRIRRRLTAWYSLILLSALLLCGTLLYLLISQVVLGPINNTLEVTGKNFGTLWLNDPSGQCPLLTPTDVEAQFFDPYYRRYRGLFYFACFDAHGTLLQDSAQAQYIRNSIAIPHSVTQAAAKEAIRSSPSIDTVDAGGNIGPIQIYAQTITDPSGKVSGVVEVGYPVPTQVDVLHQFLLLLLTVGAIALLAATVGGLFLARRALAPARLAFARQQSFIADASHELRTPLTLLRADAEVLLRGGDHLTPDDRLLLEDIVAEAAHMTALAGTMLTLARLDAGRLHLERDVVDLAAVATRVAHRAAALARENGVAIHVEGVEPLLVIGDHLLLEQVALILVDNAIKYNHRDGQVILRTSSGGSEAVLEVCDTGIGIAQEHLPHLGERFYRVDKARSREGGGAGLGLSIARSVASAHGGALTLSSTSGAGTIARLSVPATGDRRQATGDR